MFDFEYDNVNQYKKGNFKSNHILHEIDFPYCIKEIPIYIVTSNYLSKKFLHEYKQYIKKYYNDFKDFGGYTLLYGLNHKKDNLNITKDVIMQYTIDFKSYIPKNSIIFSIENATKLLTFDNGINFKSFNDTIFNKTYFYHPELYSYVFPVPSFKSLQQFKQLDTEYTKRFWKHQVNKAFSNDISFSRIPILQIEVIDDPNEFLKQNMEVKEVAWDIETSGLDYFTDTIGCITMAFNEYKGYYLEWDKIDKSLLNKFFENKYQILANGKFDNKFLRHQGITNCKIDFDTYNAGHVLNEQRSNSLKTHAWIYTNYGGYDKELELSKNKYKKANYLQLQSKELKKYATMDAIITFQVYRAMKKQMEDISNHIYFKNSKHNLMTYYFNEVIPALNTFIDIELEGVYVDWDKLHTLGIDLEKEIDKIKKEIYSKFNINSITTHDMFNKSQKTFETNINSNKQLSVKLKELNWSCYGKSKSGDYIINDETLKKWVKDGHDEAKLLLQYHELTTLQKTFIGKKEDKNGLWKYKRKDGKLHPTFFVMLADSGRNRCKAPNLQNQVKRGAWAKKFKSIFCPPSSDYYIAELDAAGFQLRIGAILSQDENMKDAFINKGGDLHSMTANSVLLNNRYSFEEFMELKNQGDDNIKKIRFKAKAVNFGLEFNCAAINLAKQSLESEWTIDECKKYIKDNRLENLLINLKSFNPTLEEHFYYYWVVAADVKKKFFNQYPGLKDWIDNQIEFAHKYGFVVSSFGAIRRLEYLKYPEEGNDKHIKNLENISCNSVVQNYEVVLMNRAITRLHKYIKENNLESKIINNVHDSIVMYIHKTELDIIYMKAKEFFEEDIEENNQIPLELECDLSDYDKGQYWGFGKEYTLSDIE